MKISEQMDAKNINILVFQGSWCPMCVSAMPQIAKFISTNSVDESKVEIINVNRTKSEPADRIAEYNITRVPTVVIKENGKEVSRITEFAPLGWKTELENIFEGI